MTDTTQTNKDQGANNNANQGNDGANANNQGGDNSQGQGNNQGANQGAGANNANANQGANQGNNQAGAEDYKKKFGESTTENQRLMKLMQDAGIDPKTGKKLDAGQGGANDNTNQNNQGAGDTYFTDDELEATFPSYATMTDQEKAVLKQVGSFPKMARMVAEMHDKLTFGEQLEVLKANPVNKILADNEKEFKEFAYKDGNLKTDINILADAFIGKKLREQGNNNGNANQNQGGDNQGRQGMENGSNGQGQGGDTTQEMTAEAARDLRKKDPRKYNALARAGKIKIASGN